MTMDQLARKLWAVHLGDACGPTWEELPKIEQDSWRRVAEEAIKQANKILRKK